ncbi:MAG: DUF3311 domain-containing protein [Acidobacteria bacterium]|nr:DUF3311 domain-containing protein [Acidobacteriota bacterium]
MSSKHWLALGLIAAMYLLHNDWWLWNDSSLVAGVPVGLAYHVGYMMVSAVVLTAVVKLAWPSDLDSGDDQ